MAYVRTCKQIHHAIPLNTHGRQQPLEKVKDAFLPIFHVTPTRVHSETYPYSFQSTDPNHSPFYSLHPHSPGFNVVTLSTLTNIPIPP